MGRYISLINWTDQGIKNFRETVDRAEAAGKIAEQMGGTLKETYWTVGQYDLVAVAEFPDEKTATAFLLALGSIGNIRTTSLTAFDKDEMREIIQKV